MQKSTFGLIAAMQQESKALLRQVQSWKRFSLGRLLAYTFSISDQICVLVTSGMGQRRAAEATRLLVEQAHPNRIISFGIAGAVEAALDIGDVVLPDACYSWAGTSLGESIPLATWPQEAVDKAAQALLAFGKHIFNGTAITTTGSQLAQRQLGEIPHPVLEMETVGIAKVAADHGIPCYSLRSISDGPRAPIPVDLGQVMDEDANLKVGKMLVLLLRNPGVLGQGMRMMRNTDAAAMSAATALVEILKEPDLL